MVRTKILLIEDEPSVRENILELLDAEDFEAIAGSNGRIGIELAQDESPDLIICDVMMPELDGYQVLQTLRKHPDTATIPFMFLTARAEKTDQRQGMELGADDYLTKPFTRVELLGAITTRLEKQAALELQKDKKLDDLRSNITLYLPYEMDKPLNRILDISQLIMEKWESLERYQIKTMAEDIHQSGERLLRLIQNFLLYAELEIIATDSKKIENLRKTTSKLPNPVLANLIQNLAQKTGRVADLQLDWQETTIAMSQNRLNKMLEELINNAFKFSQEGTPVWVKNYSENNRFILSVHDKGQGISEAEMAELEADLQFKGNLYEQQGSGLGLVIAKRLVELHGGKLTIHSTLGEQTTVQVMLPLISKGLLP
ncbi:hybrid sensor histidine kinase/response regulator [Moorena producens PAL-8-15-08-1]|uniref:histidine kinase n=1 Tax=Moorena producens PAL-8-15-08-1 TaxID=1458985 RepID=A0A1D8TYY2_9CYAN|nr:response regulator [Moorena producens]AOX02861.1 hybrid sensor histidine kinase/response regulator [Moorena producens PAL-8-15-08-1]